MRMDWLDRLNVTAIAVFSLITLVMVVNNEIIKSRQPVAQKSDFAAERARTFKLQIEKEAVIYKEVRELIKTKDYVHAISQLDEIIKKKPGLSRSYVHMAEISVVQNKKGQALMFYKKAIELEPAYVDKNSPIKIGHEIKPLVSEMRGILEKKISQRPVSKETKTALKDVYYLQRRLAGGCE